MRAAICSLVRPLASILATANSLGSSSDIGESSSRRATSCTRDSMSGSIKLRPEPRLLARARSSRATGNSICARRRNATKCPNAGNRGSNCRRPGSNKHPKANAETRRRKATAASMPFHLPSSCTSIKTQSGRPLSKAICSAFSPDALWPQTWISRVLPIPAPAAGAISVVFDHNISEQIKRSLRLPNPNHKHLKG